MKSRGWSRPLDGYRALLILGRAARDRRAAHTIKSDLWVRRI
jgi:hypothetical protein